MIRIKYILIICLFLAVSCGHRESLRKRAYHSLDTVIRLYEAGIDSIDAELLAPALAYFPEKGDAFTKGRLWYQWGFISFSRGDYDKAIVSFEKGLEQTRLSGDHHLEGLICRAMADTYNHTFNIREDTVYLRRAMDAFGAGNDTLYQAETALRLVLAFINDREWDKAGAILDQVTPIAIRDRMLYAPCMNVTATYALNSPEEDAAKAIHCFEELAAMGFPLSDDKLCDWGYALYLEGRKAEALRLWDSVEQRHPEGFNQLNYRRYEVYCLEGNTRDALPLLEESTTNQDIVLRGQTSEAVSRSQRDYLEAVAEGERLKAARELDRRRAVLAVGILLLLLLSMTAFLLWQKARDRLVTVRRALEESERMTRKLSEAEHRHLNKIHSLSHTVRTREQELEDIRSEYLFMLRDGYKRLGRLFEDKCFAETQTQTESVLFKRVSDILKEIDGDEKGILRLQDYIEEHLGHPISGLRKDIPSLKEKDILLFCYLVIGYDAPLISVLMGTEKESTVYCWKNRLLERIKRLPAARARRYLDLVR
ncbi:MAG: hypothetical protein IKV62_00955 [Bacteroidales bacterium]|nr:hypothetical protein [Bacteroidales bacterium]